MKERYLIVGGRIRQELDDLEQVIHRAERALAASETGSADQELLIDAAALNLHDFYTGLERIFQHIANAVDTSTPSGRDWHRDLLAQMSLALPGVRPQVVSPEVATRLREYLGFRHVVRNVYAFHFDPIRVKQLAKGLTKLFSEIRAELQIFIEFLQQTDLDADGVE